MNKVRWGIVSAGNIAETFARDIVHVPNAEAVAVAARKLEPAEAFAARHGIARAYEGYDALFNDPDIDVVYVATPHTLHLPNSSAALRASKAVLCEKPLTTSAAECESLLEVANDTDAYLMEAMWTWFLPAIQKAKSWLDEGRIGDLTHIHSDFGFYRQYDPDTRVYNAALAGGCLLDLGIYPIAIARYFTGKAPASIEAISHHAPNGVEDHVVMQFDYGKVVASLATSLRCTLDNVTTLVGTKGVIRIPNAWSAKECHLYSGDQNIESFDDGRLGSGFEFQIESVSNDVRLGRRQSSIVPHAASLAFQEDMDRVRACF